MSVFTSVLVGVDLMQPDKHDRYSFSPPVEEAIKNGLWLAERAGAMITFFAAVDLPQAKLHLLEKDQCPEADELLRSGLKILNRRVETARHLGLTASSKLVSGQAWVEIIREVERGRHDVVIVGTRNVDTFQRLLFGSTSMHLLHSCPCPVWVTRPEPRPLPHNILVTSDFSPVSDITVKLGLAVGGLSGAKVNLLHEVDFVVDRRYSVGLLHHKTEEYHAQVKQEALEQLADQLARVAGDQSVGNVELHIVGGEMTADTAILEFVDQHQIDLVLMGTMARGGFAGAAIGNTAERLVKHVHCSMLVIKPADFHSSIHATPTPNS